MTIPKNRYFNARLGDEPLGHFENTYYLHDLGFNLLYFDFRALGESGGKVSSIGYLETRDAQAAIRFLQETRPESCKK